MRVLEGEEKNALISSITKTDDYKVVARQLEELGLEPILEEAYGVEILEARDAILTKRLGLSLMFARKSDGFLLVSIFILEESYSQSRVYRFDKETNTLNLVSGTIDGKNLVFPLKGQTLSSCDPCKVLMNECVSIDLLCVLQNCFDCYDPCACLPACLAVCAGCIIL